ncbi:hypothetical protein [Glycomyces arizonensis]|uniref:hypothetical protein n=1 Tax=Glycomyces arizonensis TaxID=256035 RepID=UPI0003FFA451|nr:hypothetical protein [Glycomyces arizonensis]
MTPQGFTWIDRLIWAWWIGLAKTGAALEATIGALQDAAAWMAWPFIVAFDRFSEWAWRIERRFRRLPPPS